MKSNMGGAHNPYRAQAEVVSERDIAQVLYDRHEVSDIIERFGLGLPFSEDAPRQVTERDLDERFTAYATDLSLLAMYGDRIDIPLLHSAFDLVLDDMNRIAHQKLEPETKMQKFGRIVLHKTRPIPSTYRHFAYHDDKFWYDQFPKQFYEANRLKRLEDESNTAYLARYFAGTLHGFALAPYSYLPQAVARK